jgi:hypothetical protein
LHRVCHLERSLSGGVCRHFLGFRLNFFDATNHVERTFWKVVILAVNNRFKGRDCVFEWNLNTVRTGEDFLSSESRENNMRRLLFSSHFRFSLRASPTS